MVRKLFGVLAVGLTLCLGAVLADEFAGQVTKLDTGKRTITVKGDDGKETAYEYDVDVKVTGGGGGKGGGGGGKGGKGGKGGGGPVTGGIEILATALENAGDRGVKANLTRDDKTKKITEVKTMGRGGRGGGGNQ
jgi:hypothetical protein